MSDVSDADISIAEAEADIFDADFTVRRYWDEPENSSIDLLRCEDRPEEGVTSFGTIGLSARERGDGQGRTELVGACRTRFPYFDNIISTVAFNVINSGWACEVGALHNDVVTMYEASPTLEHVILLLPSLWGRTFPPLELPDRTVNWLMVMPISESEFVYAEQHGAAALVRQLEESGAELTDLHRAPAI
jgi:antitoxin YqcF